MRRYQSPPADSSFDSSSALSQLRDSRESSARVRQAGSLTGAGLDCLAMEKLTSPERRVLELMTGVVDGKRRSMDEVAQRFGVTAKRIEDILALAKRKLNQPA